jgi:Flp pilus assembly protein TadD
MYWICVPTAQEGEEYLVKAVKMRPHIAKYHVNLGVIYHLQKRYEQAESCYLTALQLEPGMPSAEDNLRKLHSTLSKLSKEP